MGILDVIKRWFGGGKPASTRPEPAKSTPQTHNFAPAPSAPSTPASTQPASPLSATEALDVIAVNRAVKAAAAVDRREKPRVNARDGTRVLIIDDSPTIVALLKRMLEQNGYKAVEAIDAETGIAIATSEAPDLIFLDIVLPGMNGFEALRRLRRDPVTKTTPIVMISGNELATEQFYAQRIGADDFMKKPFSRSEVFARIEKLLDADKVPRRHLAAAASVAAANSGAPSGTAIPAIAMPIDAGAAKTVPAAPLAEPAAPAPAEVAKAAAAPTAPDVVARVVAAVPAAPEIEVPVAAAPTSPETEKPAAATMAPAEEVTLPITEAAEAAPLAEASAMEPALIVTEVIVMTSSAEPAPLESSPEVAAPAAAEAATTDAVASEDPAPAAAETAAAEAASPVVPDVATAPATETLEAIAAAEHAPPKAPAQTDTISIEESFHAQTADIVDTTPIPVAAVAGIAPPATSQAMSESPMLVSTHFVVASSAAPITASAIASPIQTTGHQATSG